MLHLMKVNVNVVIGMPTVHIGEKQNKNMSDYVRVIALHEANTSYCYAFEIDTREKTVTESIKVLISYW